MSQAVGAMDGRRPTYDELLVENAALRERLRSGELRAQDYYRQLLRLVYRLIFLFAAEDRDLLHPPEASREARERYARYYFIGRQWVKMLGHPRFMRFAVQHGFPRERLMRFALSFMANLTDGAGGSVQDRLMYAMIALAPER